MEWGLFKHFSITAMQKQTAVIAFLKSNQLQPSAFPHQCYIVYVW